MNGSATAAPANGPQHLVEIRCAVYVRTAVAEDAPAVRQRESISAFIDGRAADGWRGVAKRYEDIGAAGTRLDRPGLSRLLADARAGLIDEVIVCDATRLARSPAALASILDRLAASGVEVVFADGNTAPQIKFRNQRRRSEMSDRMLTRQEAAAHLGVSEGTLADLRRRGGLPAIKIGRVYRYRPADLDAYLRANAVNEPAPPPPFPEATPVAPDSSPVQLAYAQLAELRHVRSLLDKLVRRAS
jgi:excisionase family DNA binding protein